MMVKYNPEEAVEYLNNQCWHDSVLYEIRIIRTNSLDQAIIFLNLITDEYEWKSQKVSLVFNDCYYLETKMNGGVDALSDGEMISEATANFRSAFISQVESIWDKMQFQIPELFHFSMSLASTGSEIDIVSGSVSVVAERGVEKHSTPPPIFPS